MGLMVVMLIITPYNSLAQKAKPLPPVESVVKVKGHSPHKATVYSMILPGLGQIYNKKIWKVPILYAGIGATVYAISWNGKQRTKYQNAFSDFTSFSQWKYQDPDADPQLPKPTLNRYEKILKLDFENTDKRYDDWFLTQLKNRKDYFKRNRDLSYIILAGIYVLNIIDATVDAHFFDFSVNDDLSVKVEPASNYTARAGNVLGVKCSINF